MKLSKKVLITSILISACTLAFAQAEVEDPYLEEEETSVESEYLNDAEGEIISALAAADDLDSKFVALQYLHDALDGGNTSEAVIRSLDRLAGEGITTETRTNGRLMNNFPEIRRDACLMMAKVPTEHSQKMLKDIALADKEPMVIAAAVKSLGEINIKADETVEAISFANRSNRILNPTSSLAMEVLNAFELLADSVEDKTSMIDEITKISVNPNYVLPVRQKALRLLKGMRDSGNGNSSKNNNSSSNADTEVSAK